MDASEYRLEMERKFNNVMLPILAAFFGVVVVVILAKESGVDPKLTLVVSVLVVFVIGAGMMYWWNTSVLSKEHEMRFGKRVGTSTKIHPYISSVEDAILNLIRTRLSLWGLGKAVVGPEKDALLVKWVFDHEYVEKGRIRKAVHDRLCEIGREVYEWHILSPLTNYPDHSASPEALGYAILHGVVSDEEVPMIRFDHDETAEVYRKMADGLLEKVMAQLAAGETYFDFSGLSDTADHLCCRH